jgi:hypothetical protein
VKFPANFAVTLTSGAFLRPLLSVRTLHEIQHLLATEGVVGRRDHPKLVGTIERLVRNGNLRAVLPGVYAEPGTCDSIRTRIQAVMNWDRDASWWARSPLGCPSGRRFGFPASPAASSTNVGSSQARNSLDGRFLPNLSSAGRAFVIHARRSLPWIFARRWVAMR